MRSEPAPARNPGLRVALFFLSAGLWGILMLPCGCVEETPVLEVQSEIDLPALLLSEVQNPAGPKQMGRCPIEIHNPGKVDRQVTLLRTGCSCYGVTLDGERLANNQNFLIPASGSQIVQMEFQPAQSHSDKFYTAGFSSQYEAQAPQLIAVKCRQRVFADVRLSPATMTIDADAVPGNTVNESRQLTIEHLYRASQAQLRRPVFDQLPDGMTVVDLRPVSPAQLVEKGLWKQVWVARLHLSMEVDMTDNAAPRRYGVTVPGEQAEETVAARGNLMIHLRQSVVFPNRVNFGKFQAGTTRTRRILLTNIDDNAFRIRFDQSKLPSGVKVDLNEHPEPRHFVTLSMTPRQPGPFSEMVKLQTDLYDIMELAIRVEGVAE